MKILDKLYRIQGDIRFLKIDAVPGNAKKKVGDILVYGEATGHAHRLVGGSIYEFEDNIYFASPGDMKVVHDEHNSISFEYGSYMISRQRELTSGDMTKIVQD